MKVHLILESANPPERLAELAVLAESVGITGVMHSQGDEFGTSEQEVGYFNMIDGTLWQEYTCCRVHSCAQKTLFSTIGVDSDCFLSFSFCLFGRPN